MVHRDPKTGKFVSGDGTGNPCFEQLELVHGHLAHRVDAADLDGTRQTLTRSGEPILDLGEVLDEHEVGEAVYIDFSARMYAPTTASAESFARATVQFSTDTAFNTGIAQAAALTGEDSTEDSIDTSVSSGHDNEVLIQEVMHTVANHSSTGNSVGGGPHAAEVDVVYDWRDMGLSGGPVFDEDDEIHVPVGIETDNIDDHRVLVEVMATVGLLEWDFDECPVDGRRH